MYRMKVIHAGNGACVTTGYRRLRDGKGSMKKDNETVVLKQLEGQVGGRPPGTTQTELEDLCVSCGDCVSVCPSALLQLDTDGLPSFVAGHACGCCGLCADVCSFGAIRFTSEMLAGLRRTLRTEREMAKRLREN